MWIFVNEAKPGKDRETVFVLVEVTSAPKAHRPQKV